MRIPNRKCSCGFVFSGRKIRCPRCNERRDKSTEESNENDKLQRERNRS